MSINLEISTDNINNNINITDKKENKFNKKLNFIIKNNEKISYFLKNEEYYKCINLLNNNEREIVTNIKEFGSDDRLINLLCVNLNNLGIYYKKLGHYKISLKYLLNLKEIEKKMKKDQLSYNITLLNISVIHSDCILISKTL